MIELAEIERGYHLTNEIASLCRVLTARVPELAHIDCERVLFGVAISRARGRHGIHAACTPLRFEGGKRRKEVEGREWEFPLVTRRGNEMLYYVTFYVPRFLNMKHDDKLETIVHELYHISPHFDGDLRRLGKGRHAHHGPSLKHYQTLIAPLVEQAQDLVQPKDYPFLRWNHRKLEKRFGHIVAERVKKLGPKLVG